MITNKYIFFSKNNANKQAFMLVETSIVVIILSLLLTIIITSRTLLVIAKLTKVNQDTRKMQFLIDVFRNTFDCLAGDCPLSMLPPSIRVKVPSTCFNLDTFGNQLATPVITTGFNTGYLDSTAKVSCSFYEFMALEPQSFISGNAAVSKINSIIGLNYANAIDLLSMTEYNILIASVNKDIATYLQALQNIITEYGIPSLPEASFPYPDDKVDQFNAYIYNASPSKGKTWFSTNYYDPLFANFNAANDILSGYISSLHIDSNRPKVGNIKDTMWDMITTKSSVAQYPYEASQLPVNQGKIMIIARNQSTDILLTDTINPISAFTPNFAFKYDKKFDDGMPYTGSVIAGKNISQMNTATGCTNIALPTASAVTSNLNANYLTNNSAVNGCNISIAINT